MSKVLCICIVCVDGKAISISHWSDAQIDVTGADNSISDSRYLTGNHIALHLAAKKNCSLEMLLVAKLDALLFQAGDKKHVLQCLLIVIWMKLVIWDEIGLAHAASYLKPFSNELTDGGQMH